MQNPEEPVLEFLELEEEQALRIESIKQIERQYLQSHLVSKMRPSDKRARETCSAIKRQLENLKSDYRQWAASNDLGDRPSLPRESAPPADEAPYSFAKASPFPDGIPDEDNSLEQEECLP
jgi:hypothetical protein